MKEREWMIGISYAFLTLGTVQMFAPKPTDERRAVQLGIGFSLILSSSASLVTRDPTPLVASAITIAVLFGIHEAANGAEV